MKKITRYLLLPLLALTLASCGEEETQQETHTYKDGESVILNDFESYYDLSKIRILNANFGYKSKFGINEDIDYVTHGKKSMYVESQKGTTFTFQSFFDDANIAVKDRYDFRTVHIDVYNATTKNVPISISVNVDDKNNALLRGEFVAVKDDWTSIDYDLSCLALQYNYERIRGVAVSFNIPENETMYFDNFSLIAGARLTEEDKVNQDKIAAISAKIDALPEFVTESDYDKLNSIYDDYIALSDLYRRIVSNFSTFVEKSEQYFTDAVLSKPLQPDQPFLCNDEFYAINQYVTINGTNAEFNVVPVDDDPKFEQITSEKWLKISFFETTNNMITAKGVIDSTQEYETVTFQVYNDSSYILRIWFNYANMCYVDVPAHQIANVEMSTSMFNMAQTYWAFHHVIAGTGTIVADKSNAYLTPFVLHRMSEEEIRTKMLSNFENLPNPETLVNDNEIIANLYYINNARFFYEKANDEIKSLISQNDLNKLILCEAKTTGYGVIYNSAEDKYNAWDYGSPFSSSNVTDATYNEVCKCSLVDATVKTQSLMGIGQYDENAVTKYSRVRVYVYNPMSTDIKVGFRDNQYSGHWAQEAENCEIQIAPNSWGCLEFDASYLQYNASRLNFTILLISDNAPLIGDFLVSSVYGLPALK